MPKMLYKYTTLESLALILKSRKIRLNPLTQMDDLQEAKSADAISYAPYVFISSWMDEPRESIAMWKLYSNMTSGVRIGMPEMPFERYIYPAFIVKQRAPHLYPDGLLLDLSVPINDFLNQNYTVLNANYSALLEKVEYSDQADALNPFVFFDNSEHFTIVPSNLGKIKNTYWEFQKEKRYILRFLPVNADKVAASSNQVQMVRDSFSNTKTFLDYYDLSIRDDALQQMEITLAPQFSAGNKVLLNALKEKYNPSMVITKSTLEGYVKLS